MSETIEIMSDGGSSGGRNNIDQNYNSEDVIAIGMQTLITNETFLLWVIVATVTVLFTSQSWLIRDNVYKHFFKNPFRPFAIEATVFITDILMATSLIYYIWTARNPPHGAPAEWYISIYALWFAIQGLKFMWGVTF